MLLLSTTAVPVIAAPRSGVQIKLRRLCAFLLLVLVPLTLPAQDAQQERAPSPLAVLRPEQTRAFTGSFSYIFLQKAVNSWIPDLSELTAAEIQDKLNVIDGKVDLPRKRLVYFDRTSFTTGSITTSAIYELESNGLTFSEQDLMAAAQKLKALRTEFFVPVSIAPFTLREAQRVTPEGTTTIDENGRVLKSTERPGTSHEKMILDYFATDWAELLNSSKPLSSPGEKVTYSGVSADTTTTLTFEADGTLTSSETQWSTPAGWIRETVARYDGWTTGAAVMLPRRKDWQTRLLDGSRKLTLVESGFRLLTLDGEDFTEKQ